MKKYFVAAVVAMMAFAFAAFAASLNVDGGVLQAGVYNDLACAAEVEVDFVTSNNGQGFWVGGATLTFKDDNGDTTSNCDGEYVALSLMDEKAGVPNVAPQQLVFAISADPITGGVASVDWTDGQVSVADVEQVQVLAGEQGTPGFSYP
jgi:hypothetical protein